MDTDLRLLIINIVWGLHAFFDKQRFFRLILSVA